MRACSHWNGSFDSKSPDLLPAHAKNIKKKYIKKKTTITGVSCKSENLTISYEASIQSHPFLRDSRETSDVTSPAMMGWAGLLENANAEADVKWGNRSSWWLQYTEHITRSCNSTRYSMRRKPKVYLGQQQLPKEQTNKCLRWHTADYQTEDNSKETSCGITMCSRHIKDWHTMMWFYPQKLPMNNRNNH